MGLSALPKYKLTGKENIKVDEIESGKVEPKKDNFSVIDSEFVEKVLNKDLMNIEALLDNAKMNEYPIEFMANEIQRLINSSEDEFT